jgi:two-component system, OmpR family, phosphate regulon sensor histidine kinase PhoR
MYQDNFWMILILLMFTSMFIWKISRSISSPIEDLIKNINSMPKDNWKGISTNAHSDELLTLVESLNKMGLDSNHNLKRIEKDAEEQETIFRNMQEGIIALDKSDKIIKINDSALKMFNCQSSNPRGKSIEGLVRNQDFIKLLSDVKNEEQAIVVDINILDKIPKIIQINANCITDKSNNFSGSLFVLADITQVKKLESMKRDFVSNVSHELKTPLTSIKGYIETLLYSENLDSELTEKFLNKINKNSNRLQSIIEDLLILSKVEQKGLGNEELEKVRLIEILNHIVEECQQKQLSVDSLKIECDKEIQIKVHRSLFTQALLNLLDNAYKYSDSIPEISILVEASDSSVAISISDRGQGIEEQHLPHLLERFYRVDKARSRDKGGTGLGLSIVKHIIQAHKGKVEIQSQIGKGSTFKVIIPKNNLTQS